MLMVGTGPGEVDQLLRGGVLACPGCAGVLRAWGHARWRSCRGELGAVRHRPRRARCSGCGATHVLLPCWVLARRADAVAVIGAALLAKAAGRGHRPIAAELGRPVSTVRGWLRRFAARARGLRVLFTGLLHALDPCAGPLPQAASVFADALEALGRAGAAAVRRLGSISPWQFASSASGGLLLWPLPVLPAAAAVVGLVSNTS